MKKLTNKYCTLFLLFIIIFDLFIYSCNDDNPITVCPPQTEYPNLDKSPAWMPDGQRIIYFHSGIDSVLLDGGYTINPDSAGFWFINLDGTNKRRFLKGSYFESPDISPDGKWILYSTGNQIYKIDTSGNNLTQLTYEGGLNARWSPDGKKVIYERCSQDSTGIYIMT